MPWWKMKRYSTDYITKGAIIGALYVILTFASSACGLSSGVIQVRFSEALCILPVLMPSAVPGLFVGCIIANLFTGAAFFDVVFGSVATLIGALGTYCMRNVKCRYLGCLPPIVANTLIIPVILMKVYAFEGSYGYFVLTVGMGEIVSAGILGCILLSILNKRKGMLR